jgi:tetratricopeptide (TPR) repeat protein
MAGAFEPARERAARAHQMLIELGPSITAASTSIESSRIEMLAGDLQRAEAALRSDHESLEVMGEHYYRASIAGLLAHVLAAQGQLGEAERFAGIAREIADPEDIEVQILWRSAQARILAARGDHEGAIPDAEEAVRLASMTVDIVLQADALADFADVLEAAGRGSEVQAAREAAQALYEQKGSRAGMARLQGVRPEAESSIS